MSAPPTLGFQLAAAVEEVCYLDELAYDPGWVKLREIIPRAHEAMTAALAALRDSEWTTHDPDDQDQALFCPRCGCLSPNNSFGAVMDFYDDDPPDTGDQDHDDDANDEWFAAHTGHAEGCQLAEAIRLLEGGA